jgi:glycosyltransferase involved in cell wall biosynthesis
VGVDEKLFCRKNILDTPDDIKAIRDVSDLLFLSIASIVPVKNHARLIKTFDKLVERYNSKLKIKLLLIGGYRSKMALAKSNSGIYLAERHHAELPTYYNMADVFFLPSLSEANP